MHGQGEEIRLGQNFCALAGVNVHVCAGLETDCRATVVGDIRLTDVILFLAYYVERGDTKVHINVVCFASPETCYRV